MQDATLRIVSYGRSECDGHEEESWCVNWGPFILNKDDKRTFEVVYDRWEVMDLVADYLGIRMEDRTWSKE